MIHKIMFYNLQSVHKIIKWTSLKIQRYTLTSKLVFISCDQWFCAHDLLVLFFSVPCWIFLLSGYFLWVRIYFICFTFLNTLFTFFQQSLEIKLCKLYEIYSDVIFYHILLHRIPFIWDKMFVSMVNIQNYFHYAKGN